MSSINVRGKWFNNVPLSPANEQMLNTLMNEVSTPEPEYHTYKGVTFERDMWRYKGYAYTEAYELMTQWYTDFTDDDHAALMDLKANPVKVATTPSTVASEPTRIEKALKSLAKAYPYLAAHADHIDGEFDEALRIVRSALAKPATEAEALAVLVGLGWKEHALSQYVGFSKPDNIRVVRSPMMHVRVLIAPEGE